LYQKPAGDAGVGRWALATYATTDEDWHESGEMEGAIPAGPLALGRQGNRFFVAAIGEGGPEAAPLDMPAGPREPPRLGEFSSLPSAEARPPSPENIAFLLSVAALALLLLVVSWQRARMGAGAAPAASGAPAALVPASLARRGIAIAIDYALVSFALAPVWQVLWPDMLQRMDLWVLMQRVAEGDASAKDDILIIYAVWSVAIVTYTALAEGFFGRTLGKHLLGIEVRSALGGASVTWRQAVLRNALRVVDELPAAYLIGLISIVIGPKPQRLGDRLAGTMVVMRSSVGPRPPG
jgi:hypothetical protein